MPLAVNPKTNLKTIAESCAEAGKSRLTGEEQDNYDRRKHGTAARVDCT